MAYTALQYGSKGEDVKRLQTALNGAGYNSGAVDGIYGEKTEAALKSYQQANGLGASGALDEATYNSLYGQATQQPAQAEQAAGNAAQQTEGLKGVSQGTQAKLDQYSQGYTPSDTVNQAQAYLQQVQSQKPGAFSSPYDQQMQDAYNRIVNREQFSYDVNQDAIYQQYKDAYMQQGKQAMMDAMGQAAALTGGYGSSYASAAGNQAYQQYLTKLNEVVPELAQQAYQRYVQQGEDLLNQYGMASDMYNRDYEAYRDSVSDWQTERGYASDEYDAAYSRDYNEYADQLAYWQSMAGAENEQYINDESQNREYAYQTAMLMLQNGQMPSAELLAAAGISRGDASGLRSAYQKSSGGSGGSGGSSGSSGSSNNSGDMEAEDSAEFSAADVAKEIVNGVGEQKNANLAKSKAYNTVSQMQSLSESEKAAVRAELEKYY